MSFNSDFSQDDIMHDINMTPLVDVMLVLLIIFMITVPVLTHSIAIDLPSADAVENKIKPEFITLSITDEAEIYWNYGLITQAELQQRLEVAAAQTPQPDIQLRGARKVAYEHVVYIMSAAQKAGLLSLGFVTEAEK